MFTNGERERERERERAYLCKKGKRVVERNNKKKNVKIDYLNKIDCRIDGLMWIILRSEYVK